MATLYIEHSITVVQTWLGAFTRFEDARRKAGVRAQRICQPVDDEKYIWVTLKFDRAEEAAHCPAPAECVRVRAARPSGAAQTVVSRRPLKAARRAPAREPFPI
jgi:hypothetical protein